MEFLDRLIGELNDIVKLGTEHLGAGLGQETVLIIIQNLSQATEGSFDIDIHDTLQGGANHVGEGGLLSFLVIPVVERADHLKLGLPGEEIFSWEVPKILGLDDAPSGSGGFFRQLATVESVPASSLSLKTVVRNL